HAGSRVRSRRHPLRSVPRSRAQGKLHGVIRAVPLVIALAAACGPADFGGPGALPPTPSGPPEAKAPSAPADSDRVPILVAADAGEGRDAVVSLGVPFAPGAMKDAAQIFIKDAQGAPVPRDVQVLARWPLDGSVRSALVAWKTSLGPAQSALFRMKLA